jgi:hypothetical protein
MMGELVRVADAVNRPMLIEQYAGKTSGTISNPVKKAAAPKA